MYLILDIGSSSVRALIMNSAGEIQALARREHRLNPDATTHPERLRGLLETCIDEVLQHPHADKVQAVGMATLVSNLIGLGADGVPLTPLLTYAHTQSNPYAEALQQMYSLTDVHARTGCRIHPAYYPAQLRWLQATDPTTYDAVHHWRDMATYCYRVWFGRDVPCSTSIASWSGLLNRHTGAWDSTWLSDLALDAAKLPTLAEFTATQHGLSSTYAERWPALADVPFYLAIGDGAGANIGSGGVDALNPVLTIGTSAALRVVLPQTPTTLSPALWAYRVDSQRHLIGGATNEGGNVWAWARETLRLEAETVQTELATRAIGAHGLTALPLFAGERSPHYRADATATLHGLRLDTTPLDILQALLEGVAVRLRLIYDLMGRPSDTLLAGGGALVSSPEWAQIIADVVGVNVKMINLPEPTAYGVVLLLHEHNTGKVTPSPAIKQVFSPRRQMAQAVQELLERHSQLEARLTPKN